MFSDFYKRETKQPQMDGTTQESQLSWPTQLSTDIFRDEGHSLEDSNVNIVDRDDGLRG